MSAGSTLTGGQLRFLSAEAGKSGRRFFTRLFASWESVKMNSKSYAKLPAGSAPFSLGENLPNGVDAPVLSLEVSADQNFTKQPGAEHHQTRQ